MEVATLRQCLKENQTKTKKYKAKIKALSLKITDLKSK